MADYFGILHRESDVRALLSSTLLGFCLLAWAPAVVSAQTPAPDPGAPAAITPGFLTRTGVSIGLAHLTAGDPHFNWAARFHGDIDVADYGRGRINLYGEYDAVFGSERRVFDLNHENYTVDVSATYRAGASEFFGVIHHVSRHLTDRLNTRAIARNSNGAAVQRTFAGDRNSARVRIELAHVFQHTYVDYTWTAWLTVAADTRIAPHLVIYGKANGGFQGVDRAIAGRDRLCGARFEGGTHVLGLKGGADLYLAYERRIDAYPLSYQRSRWVEFGFRLGTR
jgi:hypothetical protein